MFKTTAAAALMAVSGAAASAGVISTIDFEGTPVGAYNAPLTVGIATFSTEFFPLRVAQVGAPPTEGFVFDSGPNDTPVPPGTQLGQRFLSTNFETTSELLVHFKNPLEGLSWDFADIDGSQDETDETDGLLQEQFSVYFFKNKYNFGDPLGGANQLDELSFNDDDPDTGDGVITPVSYTAPDGHHIQSILFVGTTLGETRNIGIAVDNFELDAKIPVPAAFPLLLAGLGAFAALKRRKTA